MTRCVENEMLNKGFYGIMSNGLKPNDVMLHE